jgi:hypothetical protein
MSGLEGEVCVSLLEQLSEALAKLAETGNDIELKTALTLCRGFADRIVRDRDIEGSLAERLLNRGDRLN